MNPAHSHLLINHFPIIGLILAIIILLIGILAKSSVTRRVGLLLFFLAGATAIPSFSTGEGAEHYLKDYTEKHPGCSDGCTCSQEAMVENEKVLNHMIHEHEEKAEALMPFMWGIILFSAIALFLEFKRKSMASAASIVVLVIGVIAAYFAKEVGNSGGEITHTEIRKEGKVVSDQDDHDDDHDED